MSLGQSQKCAHPKTNHACRPSKISIVSPQVPNTVRTRSRLVRSGSNWGCRTVNSIEPLFRNRSSIGLFQAPLTCSMINECGTADVSPSALRLQVLGPGYFLEQQVFLVGSARGDPGQQEGCEGVRGIERHTQKTRRGGAVNGMYGMDGMRTNRIPLTESTLYSHIHKRVP